MARFEAGDVRGSYCPDCHGIWLTSINVRHVRGLVVNANSSSVEWGVALGDGMAQLIEAVISAL